MRGKVCWNWSRWSVDGITPAYAGKRYIFKGLLCGFKDHPRLCGEKCAEPSIVVTIQGSPPPMRGKVVRAIPDILRKRITPAYAGKSPFVNQTCTPAQGSPPPMRGKVQDVTDKAYTGGITPAYAGKRSCTPTSCCRYRDHPRLCGEKLLVYTPKTPYVGSPPPMRGKVIT